MPSTTMRWLTFHFVGDNDAASSFDVLPFATADEAVGMLGAMFAEHRSCRAVEIYEDKTLILRVERPANDPHLTGARGAAWNRPVGDYGAGAVDRSEDAANQPLS